MRKFGLLTMAVTLGLFGLAGRVQAANTNALIVTFQITGLIGKTNDITKSGVETTTYTTTAAKISNLTILNMLGTEFGTTFPAGAQLAYNLSGSHGSDFAVLDKDGNTILNCSTNPADSAFYFGLSNNVTGATAPDVYVGKLVNNMVTTNATETITASEPDEGIFYNDSHNNSFHVDGLLTLKATINETSTATTYGSVSFTIAGDGGGTFFNPSDASNDTAVFTKVKITASGKNLAQ